jgi:hypothetical protein
MSGLSRRLKQLDEELLALGEETMLPEELDGFIAGLLSPKRGALLRGSLSEIFNIVEKQTRTTTFVPRARSRADMAAAWKLWSGHVSAVMATTN